MKCYNVTCVDNAGNSYKAKIETDETFKEIEHAFFNTLSYYGA